MVAATITPCPRAVSLFSFYFFFYFFFFFFSPLFRFCGRPRKSCQRECSVSWLALSCPVRAPPQSEVGVSSGAFRQCASCAQLVVTAFVWWRKGVKSQYGYVAMSLYHCVAVSPCRRVAVSVMSSPGHGLGCKGWLTICRRKMWHGPRTQMLRQCPSSTLGNLLHARAPGVSFGSLYGRIIIPQLGLCGSDCVDPRWLLQMGREQLHTTMACSAITRRHAVGRAMVETLTERQVYLVQYELTQFPSHLLRTRKKHHGRGDPTSKSVFHPADNSISRRVTYPESKHAQYR